MKKVIQTIVVLLAMQINAQEINADKEKIVEVFANYFELNRETIHLHLNKNIYFTNENIWFKGYVFDRKLNNPFALTKNVFMILYDENGVQMQQKLVYANNGWFCNAFKLNRKYKTGNYYLHAYTNWMNNFTENESSIFKVKIINETDSSLMEKKSVYKVEFFPEGGNFIEGINNNVGFKISNCNENSKTVSAAKIVDSKGKNLQTINVNSFGNGKFYFTPDNETYKFLFEIDGKTHETPLPRPSPTGFAIEANNYIQENTTVLKIRTNEKTIKLLESKPLYLIVQQNDKVSIFDVDNKKTIQDLVFSNENLFVGTNTLRIIDKDFNQYAERLVFKQLDYSSTMTIEKVKKSDKYIDLLLQSDFKNANLSISILPENSIAVSENTDIYASLMLNPYMSSKNNDAKYYLEENTRAKKHEMDLMLLTQKSNTSSLIDMIQKTPKQQYEFEMGLNVKGTVNSSWKEVKNKKIEMTDIFGDTISSAIINDKNEFYFKNVFVSDSSKVNYNILNKDEKLSFNYFTTITNSKRNFNKSFETNVSNCINDSTQIKEIKYAMPRFRKDEILLNDVEVKQEKNKLTRKGYRNSMLRGYKVLPTDNGDVLDYIGNNGFKVGKDLSNVYISSRRITSLNGQQTSPEVYINDIRIMSFDELINIRMDDLDEIYLSPHAIVASINNKEGIIKIYTKKLNFNTKVIEKSRSQIINGGFKQNYPFENAEYLSTTDIAFQSFGVIYWFPMVYTDESGNLKFQIPNNIQEKVKLVVEGFTDDGKIISKTIIVDLK